MSTTTTDQRRAQIKEIVCDILEIEPDKLGGADLLKEDHDADSMGAIEILSALERTFGVHIDQSELANMTSLDAIVAVVDKASTR
jgi:acyl carrier protein